MEDWDYYVCDLDGEKAGVFLNLNLHATAPEVERRISLRIATKLLSPDDTGLQDSDEDEASRLEDDLEETMAARMDAVYIGRITHSGLREFYFYASGSQGMLQAAKEVEKRHPEFKLDAGSAPDNKWDQYLQVMYPAPDVLRSMRNQKVLAALQEHGDELTQPRDVEHHVFFASPEARTEFRRKAAEKKFAVRRELNSPNEDAVPLPFGLILWRNDKVDAANIDKITAELEALAAKFEGRYDGWESPVV
jgi:regulator of RNase E activity RraB